MTNADRMPRTAHLATKQAEDRTIEKAIAILATRLSHRDTLSTPDAVHQFLRLQAAGLNHEVFAVMFLDPQRRLIAYEPMFRGTLTEMSVYPREIVRRALELGAHALILHHNHPAGPCTPTPQDLTATHLIRAALGLVGVQVEDHVITSEDGAASMADQGLL